MIRSISGSASTDEETGDGMDEAEDGMDAGIVRPREEGPGRTTETEASQPPVFPSIGVSLSGPNKPYNPGLAWCGLAW
jgi:hypothetical protein